MSPPHQIAIPDDPGLQRHASALAPTGNPVKDARIGAFMAWCDMNGVPHDRDALTAYVDAMIEICAPDTVRGHLWALKDGYRTRCLDVGSSFTRFEELFKELYRSVPKVIKDRPKTISRAQYKAMLSACAGAGKEQRTWEVLKQKKRVFIRALWETGARVSELCECKRSFVQIDQGRTILELHGKGKKIRTIPIDPKLPAAILREFGPGGEWLFPAGRRSGGVLGHLHRNTAWTWVNNAGAAIGIKAHPHLFRHSYATRLIEAGVNVSIVQRMLGHRNINTTMIYTHLEIPIDEILEAAK